MSCSKSPTLLLLLLCYCRWDDNNAAAASATSSTATTTVESITSISSSSLIVPNNDNNDQQIDQHPSSLSSTITQSSPSWSNNILQQTLQNQDPYVAASPLSVAAVCNDGIALVSLHYNADHEEEEDEEEEGRSTSEIANIFRDLPISTRGPLRIEPIYENTMKSSSSSSYVPPPMALLTAGWRTDGLTLCNAARELISEEVRLFCLPALTTATTTMMTNNNNENENMSTNVAASSRRENEQENMLIENIEQTTNNNVVMKKETTTQQPHSQAPQRQVQQKQQSSYHGRRIAEGLSYYLSKCQFSSGIRSLSTVGLLACGTTGGCRSSSSSTNNNNGGSLYLIDTTGTHRVRAHAIGNGSFNLHKRMVFIDFSTMDCLEGLKVLLRLIAEEGGLALPSVEEEEEKEGVENDDDTITIEATKSKLNSVLIKKPAFLTKRQNQQHSQQGKDEEEEEKLLDNLPKWDIPSNTAVELAVLKHGDGRLRRIRLSSLMQ